MTIWGVFGVPNTYQEWYLIDESNMETEENYPRKHQNVEEQSSQLTEQQNNRSI